MMIDLSQVAIRNRILRELATRNQVLCRPHRNGECHVIDGDRVIGRWPNLAALAQELRLIKSWERAAA